MRFARSYDLFCRVVDNFGDAAVCWRLARGLARTGEAPVRLWIDQLEALRTLVPSLEDRARQSHDGIEIGVWNEATDFGAPAEVVIDAFGGGVPDRYAEALSPKAIWIVLEYLSAEPWVVEHHGLPSPHPRLPVRRYFFFPGFVPGTGGLPRERGIGALRDTFAEDPEAARALWSDLGFAPPGADACVVSLFGYENPALATLLEAWAKGASRVVVAVPQSRITPGVAEWLATSAAPGTRASHGSLEVRFLPFVPQARYDELLWASHWNFVRGEDSFVRAQWAARPFAWHIYPQADDAHRVKLEAFLGLYCEGLEPALAGEFRELWLAWNGGAPVSVIGDAWAALAPQTARLTAHARRWSERLAGLGDLAINLARFCAERLE
jgi:uncharacterized repeat protein (TIGR03837 family)